MSPLWQPQSDVLGHSLCELHASFCCGAAKCCRHVGRWGWLAQLTARPCLMWLLQACCWAWQALSRVCCVIQWVTTLGIPVGRAGQDSGINRLKRGFQNDTHQYRCQPCRTRSQKWLLLKFHSLEGVPAAFCLSRRLSWDQWVGLTPTLFKLLPLCWNSEWVSLCVSPSREESQLPTAPQFTHWFSKPDIMQVCLPVLSVGSPIWSLDPLLLRGTSGCDKPLTSHCHGAVDSDLITFLPLPPFLMCPFLYIFHSRKSVLLVLSSFWR